MARYRVLTLDLIRRGGGISHRVSSETWSPGRTVLVHAPQTCDEDCQLPAREVGRVSDTSTYEFYLELGQYSWHSKIV